MRCSFDNHLTLCEFENGVHAFRLMLGRVAFEGHGVSDDAYVCVGQRRLNQAGGREYLTWFPAEKIGDVIAGLVKGQSHLDEADLPAYALGDEVIDG